MSRRNRRSLSCSAPKASGRERPSPQPKENPVNRSAKAVATAVAVVAISACGGAHATPVRKPQPGSGGDFLPAYIQQLQGKQPFPKDRCPDPKDLHDLLIPCD